MLRDIYLFSQLRAYSHEYCNLLLSLVPCVLVKDKTNSSAHTIALLPPYSRQNACFFLPLRGELVIHSLSLDLVSLFVDSATCSLLLFGCGDFSFDLLRCEVSPSFSAPSFSGVLSGVYSEKEKANRARLLPLVF